MSRFHVKNFVRFATEASQIRFYSDNYRQTYKSRRQKQDFDKRPWKKKDTGPKIPLPDITGEVLWGIHPIQAALCAEKRTVHTAFFKTGVNNKRIANIRSLCEVRDISMLEMSGNTLDLLVGNHPHQGVCLDVSTLPIKTLRAEDISSESLIKPNGEPAVWMIPYRVKDTMNMGAILRSSHYFGVNRVLVPASYSSAMNSVVSKASAGAMEVMDIKSLKDDHRSLDQCLKKWKSAGGIIAGSSADTGHEKTMPVSQFYRDKPVLLITGSEAEGIGDEITEYCDILLSIPTYQPEAGEWLYQLDSLNVSVATGILLHNVMTNKPNNA